MAAQPTNRAPHAQVFAKRQTIWDTAVRLLSSSSSSDASLLGTLINVICIAVVNFTLGMLTSVLIFMWQLPAFLLSYKVLLSMPCPCLMACVHAASCYAQGPLTAMGSSKKVFMQC